MGGKKFKNCSDDLVILMDKKKRPFFLEKKDEHCLQMRALDFFPTVVVFRKQDEKIHGERVFKGQKYKIPKDVLYIKIDKDRVYKINDKGIEENLQQIGDEITKLEPVFEKPVGRNLPLEFHNLDENNLHVITGSRLSFQSIEIPAGEKKMVNVKSDFNRTKYDFGVAAVGRVLNPVTGSREFSATMFGLCSGGKMVKIDKTSEGFTASIEKPDGTETKVAQKGAKTFNETERLCKKELLHWLKQGVESIVGAVAGGAVGGAVEAGVGEAIGN